MTSEVRAGAPPEPLRTEDGVRRMAPPPGGAPAAVAVRFGRRSWVWPVLLPLLGALLFGGGAHLINESSASEYTADALVAVLPDDPAADVSIPVAAIWAEVGSSDAVVAQAAQALDVDERTLAAGLSATQAPNAPVISISVTTTDPQRAAAWANGVAAELLGRGEGTPVPGYGLRQVAVAEAPVSGSALLSPLVILATAAFGGVAGLVPAQRLRRIPRRRVR